jgi:hypothetical protein
MNRARLSRIMFDGVVARPMPVRRIEKAMMKRGKLVTMIRMPGATDRIVKSPKVRMIQAATEPFDGNVQKIGEAVTAIAAPSPVQATT